ncbi:NAD(P)H-hydrate epimerase [Tessaracoccus rhinocerotis]|uniref:NAD(P)H-hydrate epimerase n=1 Tax=Tessaracoccus rhinocerotis TaxID=1689449 RepID=A0A553K0Q3_9ACTN|nr:NAD(P)H-hydrate epimerase [Tessaracoccus rhinocerotis]TRY18283.1 NAD(P)H-hydrate epimerase [Tessaracoccus rhinocerotis]
MDRVVTAHQMRAAEERFFAANPDVDLMARAAAAVVEEAGGAAAPVLVAVGPGNNGGDGLFAAAALAVVRPVSIWLTAERSHPEGLAAARAAGVVELDAEAALAHLADSPLVIDAVLGIGGRPGLRGDVARLARECEDRGVRVLSVDLPSGLDADSGQLADSSPPSFHATTTVTFAALKPCHVTQPASGRCGRVVVADIGVEF